MQWFLSNRRFGPTLPACFAISLLACSINTTFAADATTATTATDLGTVGASYDGGDATHDQGQAAKAAISQSSVAARQAEAVVGDAFVRNDIAPTSDFTQIVQNTPGLFSFNENGPGMGDNTPVFRGYANGNYNMTFDGIPFNDTNGVSQHSWVFFPSPFVGGAVVDRSPGLASTIGQATFNGSINLLSRVMSPTESTTVSGTVGSWNTHVEGVEHETGQFGENGNQNLMFTVQNMTTDGYQTFNDQQRKDMSFKYTNALTDNTVLTVFGSYLNLQNHTPNAPGPTRGEIAQFGNNYLLQGTDATLSNFYRYNFDDISTDFNYIGLTSNLGNGWKLDDKVYSYRYWNKQNYAANNATAPITPTSGTDKLNSYTTDGNLLQMSKDSSLGTFRTGLWTEYARSYRYQIQSNPMDWVDGADKFDETYDTTTIQPYAEMEFKVTDRLKITPGLKYASYEQTFNHLADNGGAVGNLNGAPSVNTSVHYSNFLPSLDVHYMLAPNWSAYGQYGTGDLIPPTTIFDVPNGAVGTTPKPQSAKTVQFGTVWKNDKYTFDADIYHTKLDGAYVASPTLDANGNTVYYLGGEQYSNGVELEGNVVLGHGFSLYANGTVSSVKDDNGNWLSGAPSDTEVLGLTYLQGPWNVGAFAQRVGKSYNDGTDLNGNIVHQAFTIDPITMVNLFATYRFDKSIAFAKGGTIQFGVNNLFNQEKISAIGSATPGSTSANPDQADQLILTSGRFVSTTLTLNF
jgi:iron complex outermembrane receptor protein